MSNAYLLSNGRPDGPAIYDALANFLTENASSVLSIEIIRNSEDPATLEPQLPFLKDGLDIGIPKIVLVSCFVTARKRFQDCQRQGQFLEAENLQKLDAATKIMLLYDPEHLTAANWRKRHLTLSHESLHVNSATSRHSNGMRLKEETSKGMTGKKENPKPLPILEQEISFLTTLVTSPLKKHAKSPTLWAHRHWLMKTYTKQVLWSYPGSKHPANLLFQEELDILLKASDRHLANYAAFKYARLLSEELTHRFLPSPKKVFCPKGLDTYYKNAVATVQKWCFAHPRDISGWSFFEYLVLRAVNYLWLFGNMEWEDETAGLKRVEGEVEKWAQDMGLKRHSVVMGDREIPNGFEVFLKATDKRLRYLVSEITKAKKTKGKMLYLPD
ncbi:MAG: hypothetical protein MMC33_005860 [Icmadophila ericetorum]|nr:hypothetical protein [Icmadophila ericetorum]